MRCLEMTLREPAANLALDEALLELCEANPAVEVLRFWEPRDYFVVLGYANRAEREANLAACAKAGICVYRRCSGGGTVLQGPGCLNYSLVLHTAGGSQHLYGVAEARSQIMSRHQQALAAMLGRPVEVAGISDLALDGRKFSGNAQRHKREALIFHGTFLLGFDIAMMDLALPMPTYQPDYRQRRSHGQFVTNLGVPAARVKAVLRQAWSAAEPWDSPPEIPARLLEKYASQEWNMKF